MLLHALIWYFFLTAMVDIVNLHVCFRKVQFLSFTSPHLAMLQPSKWPRTHLFVEGCENAERAARCSACCMNTRPICCTLCSFVSAWVALKRSLAIFSPQYPETSALFLPSCSHCVSLHHSCSFSVRCPIVRAGLVSWKVMGCPVSVAFLMSNQ